MNPRLEEETTVYDTVTIGLYCEEKFFEDSVKFSKFLKEQHQLISQLKKGLYNAAGDSKKQPPQFVLSVLLVPDWEIQGNDYDNEEYKRKKADCISQIKALFEKDNITIEDFYTEGHLSNAEKKYMDRLIGRGSTADIVKTRAIINNKHCRHLQIDSNTKIIDYKKFYQHTFGAPEQTEKVNADSFQHDNLNASYYDLYYVSAHNKVVYTVPSGRIAKTLEKKYLAYCKKHQGHTADKVKNSIYARVFTEALREIKLTRKVVYLKRGGFGYVFMLKQGERPQAIDM